MNYESFNLALFLQPLELLNLNCTRPFLSFSNFKFYFIALVERVASSFGVVDK